MKKYIYILGSWFSLVSHDKVLEVQADAGIAVFKAGMDALNVAHNSINRARNSNSNAINALVERQRSLDVLADKTESRLKKMLAILED